MGEERSLLQQIGDKERELGSRLKEIVCETDRQVAAARQEAAEQVTKADEAGKQAAAEYLERERIRTDSQIAELKKAGAQNTTNIITQDEPNIPRAAAEITRRVALKK